MSPEEFRRLQDELLSQGHRLGDKKHADEYPGKIVVAGGVIMPDWMADMFGEMAALRRQEAKESPAQS
jgi:hypothetical protein